MILLKEDQIKGFNYFMNLVKDKSNNTISIDEMVKDFIKYYKIELFILKRNIQLLSEPYTMDINGYDPENNTYDKFTAINSKAYNSMPSKYNNIDYMLEIYKNIDSINSGDVRQLFKMHDEAKQLYIGSKQIVNRALRVTTKISRDANSFVNECIESINFIMTEIELTCYGQESIPKYETLRESGSIFDNIKTI